MVKKRVEKGTSKGLILGIVGIICFVLMFLVFSIASYLFLIMVVCSIAGLVYSIKDKKKGKKYTLFGIILNITVLLIWALMVLWIVLLIIFNLGDPVGP